MRYSTILAKWIQRRGVEKSEPWKLAVEVSWFARGKVSTRGESNHLVDAGEGGL
jgi:hypothetical protein